MKMLEWMAPPENNKNRNEWITDVARMGNDTINVYDGIGAGQETENTCVQHGGDSGD